MDHHWVSTSWLSDVGLPQYSQSFQTHLVDGRVLNSLSRRDLERFLNISDQYHQTSLLLAIQLLQILSFDKEVRIQIRIYTMINGLLHNRSMKFYSTTLTRLNVMAMIVHRSFRHTLSQQAPRRSLTPSLCHISSSAVICVLCCLQALQARRVKCEHQDRDPIVWTCHRVMKWIRDIDLKVGGRSVTVFPSAAESSGPDCNQIPPQIDSHENNDSFAALVASPLL